MMEKVKMYAVEFRHYTNYAEESVRSEEGDYLDVSDGPFLVREDEIDYYKAYGGGYKSLIYVGFVYKELD